MVRGETLKQNERVKVYVLEVRDTPKGPKVLVSRTHPELVKRLFEEEVAEVREGIIEIKAIAREAGSRTKIAVWSNDPDVDAVGACVGVNGSRVNTIVSELNGEKVDVINWDENQAYLIENALSPAKVISVMVDPDEKSALVIVPDYQLSLAIKIDIKSETQAREEGIFEELEQNYEEDEYGELKEKDSFEEEEDFREETGLPEEDPEAVSEEPDVEEEEASVEETAAEEDASVEEAAAEEDAEQ